MRMKRKGKQVVISPSPGLKGKGMIDLRDYPFLNIRFLPFPGGERRLEITEEQYYRLRQNRDLRVKEVRDEL